MKSKTILSEEERDRNHQREEILSMKDGITIRDSEINSIKKELEKCGDIILQFANKQAEYYKELESRRLIIESLYYENQMLIEENAGLKAKNESLKESCSCSTYDQTGWTTVKCCNHCGKSVEKFWKLS